MTPTEKNVTAWLARLGTSPNEVAEALKRRHIKGRKGCSRDCPIATYVQRHYPGYCVSVGVTGLALYMNVYPPDDINLPVPCGQFIMRFDQGMYPELEAPSEPSEA